MYDYKAGDMLDECSTEEEAEELEKELSNQFSDLGIEYDNSIEFEDEYFNKNMNNFYKYVFDKTFPKRFDSPIKLYDGTIGDFMRSYILAWPLEHVINELEKSDIHLFKIFTDHDLGESSEINTSSESFIFNETPKNLEMFEKLKEKLK